MAHLRKQIWDNIVTALNGLSTTGSRVYASRVYLYLDMPGRGRITIAQQGTSPAAPGDRLSFGATAEKIHVFRADGTAI